MTTPTELPQNVLEHLWNYKNNIQVEIANIRATNLHSDMYFEEQDSNEYHSFLKDTFIDLHFLLTGYTPHAKS